MKPWDSYFVDGMSGAVTNIVPRSAIDLVMSADRLTMTRTLNALTGYVVAVSTKSGLFKDYAEIKVNTATGTIGIGICNRFVNTNAYVGFDKNSIGISNDGNVHYGGASLTPAPGFNFNAGDTVAVAVDGAAGTIQFRNITQNTSWTAPYNFPGLGRPPYYLAVSTNAVGDSVTANFFGPFLGPVPTGFLNWNPEALFSEQPVKVLDFDAVILDGSYTSTNINDLVAMPFQDIRWGDADLDHNNNLRFTDWIIQDITDDENDWPLLSVCLTAASVPADNYIWGSWDGGPVFLINRQHLTVTTMTAVSNIPIPPPQVANPNLGEGHTLALFISCSVAAVFNWSNSRVFGTENVLVWAPIEPATWPPSALGIVQPNILPNVIQSGRMGPPVGPPLGS